MTTLPGRSFAIKLTLVNGSVAGLTDARRGFWDTAGGLWYEPVVTRAPVIKRGFAQPMRGLPSFDRVTWETIHEYSQTSFSTHNAADVVIYNEVGGALGSVLWTGKLMRHRAIKRNRDKLVFEAIDIRGFVLDGASGSKRTNYAEDGTYDPPDRDIDEPIPIRLGDYTQPELGAAALCRDKGTNDGSNDPLYIYNDVLDKDDNSMSTDGTGFTVYAIDGNTYSDVRVAKDAGLGTGYYDVTSHVISSDHTIAEFKIDRSAFDADGTIPFTLDVETTGIYCQFLGPVSNDATLTSGITLDRSGPASIAATIYVELAGISASLIDNTVIEGIDNGAGSPPVYEELSDDLTNDLADLYKSLWLQERVTPAGLITWRTRWFTEPFSSDVTVETRHHVDWPTESWGGGDPFFTSLTLERNHLPYAQDAKLVAGPVTDGILEAENGDQPVEHTEQVRWISSLTDLKTLASFMIRIQGNRVHVANIAITLDDIGTQLAIQPGDVLDWEFQESSAVQPVSSSGSLVEVMTTEHDLGTLVTKLTLWNENPARVYGGIAVTGNATATTAGVTWTKIASTFDTDLPESYVTADAANDQISILYPGVYRFVYHLSATANSADVYRFRLGAGALLTSPKSEQAIEIVSTEARSCSGGAIVKVSQAVDVGLFVNTTNGNQVTVEDCSILAERIYEDDEVPGELV